MRLRRLLISLFFLCLPFALSSQNVTIEVKDVRLQKVFFMIRQQTGLRLSYSNPPVNPRMVVSLSAKNENVCDALNRLLGSLGVSAERTPKKIILRRTQIENKSIETVSGIVTDSSGEPLQGVLVSVQNNDNKVITSKDGRFFISEPGGDVLVFSYLGMKDKMCSITQRRTMRVVMEENIIDMDDVIIVAYGTVQKASYTGSTSVISAKALKQSKAATITEAMKGFSPGMMVNGGGMPGNRSQVRIRGIGSMSGSNAPLYVIDGIVSNMDDMVQMSYSSFNPLASINPNDVESVSILKDAAAASLYGSRAANGVVLITTKQGKQGKMNVEASVASGISDMLYTPIMANQEEFAQLWVWADMHKQMYKTATTGRIDPYQYINQAYADKALYNNYLQRSRTDFNNAFRIEGKTYDFFGDGHYAYPNTNWMDQISRTGKSLQANVSLSGGQEKLSYYLSGEYNCLTSPIRQTGIDRYSGRANVISKLNPVLWLGFNVNISYTKLAAAPEGAVFPNPMRAASYLPPVIPVYNADGSYNRSFPFNVYNSYNPVDILNSSDFATISRRQTAMVWFQLNLLKNLFFKTSFGYDLRMGNEMRWYPPGVGTGKNLGGLLREYTSNKRQLTSSSILNYTLPLINQELSFMACFEAEETKTNFFGGEAYGFMTPATPVMDASSRVRSIAGNKTEDALLSVVGKADYNCQKKYFLSASYRLDGSSRFATGNKWGNFYSFSGAWLFTKESFMEGLDFLSEGKIRTSYGISGTLPSGLYDYMGRYEYGMNYNGEAGAKSLNMENYALTWEKNRIFDIGLELNFFKGRLQLEMDYYQRESSQLLLDKELSRVSGYATQITNLGSMGNRGLESEIQASVIERGNFKLNMNLNFAFLRNELKSLPTVFIAGQNINKAGYTRQSWYLKEYAGIDHNTGEPMWYILNEANGKKTPTKSYSEASLQVMGNYLPKFSGGLGSAITYKNLELSFLFIYAMGFKILDYDGFNAVLDDGYSSRGNKDIRLLDNWRPDNTSSNNPILLSGIQLGSQASSRFLHNGDYLKLKNIKLSYNFPAKLCSYLNISRLEVFASGENLFITCGLKNFDPEVSENGKRYIYQTPSTRSLMLGIDLKL